MTDIQDRAPAEPGAMADARAGSKEGSATPQSAAAPDDAESKEKVNWWAELRGLALMLLTVLAFHTFIAKPFYIPSGSMMPGLVKGDRLIVSKFPYGWNWSSISFHALGRGDWRLLPKTPEYGDIVILQPPAETDGAGIDWIKRVVALPGDRIAVVNGQIVLNGKPVPREAEVPDRLPVDANNTCDSFTYPGGQVRLPSGETVCELPTWRETLPNGASYRVLDTQPGNWLDNFAEVTVPEGHVFLMGDNRDHSSDSRAPLEGGGLGGSIPLSDIGGRAEFITFSLDGTFGWNPLSWWPALRDGRSWTSLRPTTRPIGTQPDE